MPTAIALAWAFSNAFGAAAEPPSAGSASDESATPQVAEVAELSCPARLILSSGKPDDAFLSEEASKGVHAFWCERYDAFGNAERIGPYREVYANGRIRLESTYTKVGDTTRLEGPVMIRNEDGSPFLRGFLKQGEWVGELVIFHETGKPWFEGKFDGGRLNGPVRTRHPDGALESETRYAQGKEQGLARSFFATKAGGRLKSEVRVKSDQIVGSHRLLDPEGAPRREGEPTGGLDAVWPIDTAAPVGPVGPAAPSTSAPSGELDASN